MPDEVTVKIEGLLARMKELATEIQGKNEWVALCSKEYQMELMSEISLLKGRLDCLHAGALSDLLARITGQMLPA